MREKLIEVSSFLAIIFLVIALRGTWGGATAENGTRYEVSLHGVTQILDAQLPRSASKSCAYLTGNGAMEFCAPSSEGDTSFSMLCSVFPLVVTGLVLAFAAGVVNHVSPYRSKATAAALSAASLATVFAGTCVAQISMQRGLKVFEDLPLYFGGFPFAAVWIAMALLLIAAALSTTSTLLGHG